MSPELDPEDIHDAVWEGDDGPEPYEPNPYDGTYSED